MNETILYEKGQLIGIYRIIDLLEQNTCTDMYSAQIASSGTHVKIEIIKRQLPGELQELFLVQARLLKELKHPHIWTLLDAGVSEGTPFLVTAKCTCRTLRDICPQGSQSSLAFLLPVLKKVASALDYAHSQGVYHGDLQPENILWDGDRTLFLAGFRIEAIAEDLEESSAKQSQGESFSADSEREMERCTALDQYLLAVLIYELLSGSHPSVDISQTSLRQKMPDIPAALEVVLSEVLDSAHEPRFITTEAFVTALEEAQDTPAGTEDRTSTVPLTPRMSVEKRVVPEEISTQTTVLLQEEKVALVPTTPVLDQPSTPFPLGQVENSLWSLDELVQEDTHLLEAFPVPRTQKPLRKNESSITRRSFAVGLMSLAALGGAGSWYLLSQRLSGASAAASDLGAPPPATRTTVDNKRVLIFTGHLASVNALAWSPDGKLVASASDDTYVQIFRASDGRRMILYSGHTEEVAALGWSPDGTRIASGGQDTTVQIWNASSGTKLFTYHGHTGRVNGLGWSNDSYSLASGSEDKSVQVWNASSGAIDFTFLGHTAGVLCVGWQPNDTSVASGSWDGTVRDWATIQHGDHFEAGEQIFNYDGHGKDAVSALSWSPDSSLIASAGADQTVQISNGKDGTPRLPFFTGQVNQLHVDPILSVAWSPNGKAIASGDANGNVYVWKVADRSSFFIYQGHKGAVNALAWSPDGKTIASAGADSTVQVWQPG